MICQFSDKLILSLEFDLILISIRPVDNIGYLALKNIGLLCLRFDPLKE